MGSKAVSVRKVVTDLIEVDRLNKQIDLCVELVEVVEIRKKAIALERYARMSKDFEGEMKLRKLRIWASTKFGELSREALKATPRNKGSKKDTPRGKVNSSPPREVLTHGIDKNQRAQFHQLAQAPAKVRKYLDETEMPTISGAIAAVNPVKQTRPIPQPRDYSDRSMMYLHFLKALANASSAAHLIAFGTDVRMRAEMRGLIEKVSPFLTELLKHLERQE